MRFNSVIQDSDDDDDGGAFTYTQALGMSNGGGSQDEEMYAGFNEEEEFGMAVAEEDENGGVVVFPERQDTEASNEEMISTLSAQQEIQRQHTALLAPTPTATDTSISKSSTAKTMTDASPKHPAGTDEDFPHSSPKRRKTTHGALETAKTDVWEFYADSEVDSDYGTPKTKKAAKAKDSATKGKSKKQRAKTAPTLVFDDILGGPIAPPVILDDEDDEDFVPEESTKRRGRKKSEKPPQKDKRPTPGKTVAKETETVEIFSSGDEAADPRHHLLEPTVSPAPAPASSFHVAVNGAPLATQEREQYQIFPPTGTTQDEHTQEHPASYKLPPFSAENPISFRADYSFLPTSQAMASTVPDSDLYKNTPVIPPTDTSSGHSNEPEPLDDPVQVVPQGNTDFDPTPPIPPTGTEPKEQLAEKREQVAEPEPIETVDLIREIAKEEFGLRRKSSNVGSSEIRSGPPVEDLEAAAEMPPPPRKAAKIKLTKRKKVKLQKRAQTIGAFDFDFDDEDDEDEPVSKPKPRKKKGLLALNDEEDEDWGGETPTKGRKKAAEKKPIEKKPRGRPRKKPAPLIEDEEEEHPATTTSNAPTSEPAKTGSSSQTHPIEVVDSDGDSDLSPLSELDSNFGDDDRFDDLLSKKTTSKSALSEVVNDASPSRNANEKAEDEDPVTKKGGRKGKKASTKKTKTVNSTPSVAHTSDPAEVEPTPETPAPKSKSKAKPKRKVTIKKTAETIDSDSDEAQSVPKSDPPSPAKPSEPNPPPVTPAKPTTQAPPVPATPADQIGPKNEPLSSIIKREANRGSATPGSEGKLSWQQARYRVGLSKRQRIEPLHGYLKKET